MDRIGSWSLAGDFEVMSAYVLFPISDTTTTKQPHSTPQHTSPPFLPNRSPVRKQDDCRLTTAGYKVHDL
jgi:hypothetical protein